MTTTNALGRPLKPLRYSGNSANLAFYGEPTKDADRVWCDVLSDGLDRDPVTGVFKRKPFTEFHVSVYRSGETIAKFTHTGKHRKVDTLPARTVTRLVREALSCE